MLFIIKIIELLKLFLRYIGDGEQIINNFYIIQYLNLFIRTKIYIFWIQIYFSRRLRKVDPNDFEGVVIYTNLVKKIECKTDNDKINQLIYNAYWGQRGNFLDVPTDCPQRDERLGWTADT